MTRQRARIATCGIHMFIIGVFGTQAAMAQTQPGLRAGAPAALSSGTAPIVEGTEARAVELLVGRSTLVEIGAPIARVSLTSAEVADALVTGQTQLLVHGKTPGSISMFVWDRAGAVKRYEIAVVRDLARLNEQVKHLFPGEQIQAHSNGKAVVLSGTVSSKEVAEKAVAVAGGYVEKAGDVTTLLQVQPGARNNQVLLRVRFAEVSRTAMSQFGMSFFTSATGIENNIGRVTTQQFPGGPEFKELAWSKASGDWGADVTSAEGKLEFSDFLNVFLLNQKYDLGVLIKALQNRGLFQSLAEPNLVAESGKEASFLAGGEFPVPVAQGSGANIGVSVQFKEFGIRLNFTPTINGDRVHLKVRPEVSTLDYGNAVVLSGFRIPSLSTRRAETSLELRNGQTFAIAGLMNNQVQTTMQKVPGIGDIPIIGYLFRSRAAQRDQTELVVMITPEILPTDSPGVTPSLPRYPETFLPPVAERNLRPAPAPAFSQPSRGQATAPVAAPSVVDNRTEVEKAQDRALASLDRQKQHTVGAAAVAPEAAAEKIPAALVEAQAAQAAQSKDVGPAFPAVPPPVGAQEQTAHAVESASAVSKQAGADVLEVSKEQRDLEKAARQQAERDAKAAEKARKEAVKRAAAAQADEEKLAREQAKRDAEAAKKQAKRDAELAKAQAKRDAELAKVQAKRDAELAKLKAEQDEEAARQQAETARLQAQAEKEAAAVAQRQTLETKREAEREQERQRAVDAAAERLRAAEAEYQAELARRSQR